MATPTVVSNIQSNIKGTISSIQSKGLITQVKNRLSGKASAGLGMGVIKSLKGLKPPSGSSSQKSLLGQLTSAQEPFVTKKLTFLSQKFGKAANAKTPFERTQDLLSPQIFQGTTSFGDLFKQTKIPSYLLRDEYQAETGPTKSFSESVTEPLQRPSYLVR